MYNLELNLNIYPIKYIKKAIEDYINVVEIQYNLEKDKAIITFNCDEEDFSLIKHEFCNYIIGLIGKSI